MIKEVSYDKKEKSYELRQLFINIINEKLDDTSNVGLMLSGGIDSASILYALFEIGVEVTPYTFHIDGIDSKDLSASIKLSEKYGLDINIINIPLDNLLNDFEKLYSYGCYRKTQFETKIHYLYLFPNIKEKILFGGIEADNLQGTVRSMIIHSHKDPQRFNELRQKAYTYANNINLPIDYKLAEENNFKLIYPYTDKRVYEFFLQFDWEYLNKPYHKWIMVEAFKDYFSKDSVRPHMDFQIASGMRDYCKSLVDDPSINVNNKKSPVGVYNDLMKKWEMEKNGQTTF